MKNSWYHFSMGSAPTFYTISHLDQILNLDLLMPYWPGISSLIMTQDLSNTLMVTMRCNEISCSDSSKVVLCKVNFIFPKHMPCAVSCSILDKDVETCRFIAYLCNIKDFQWVVNVSYSIEKKYCLFAIVPCSLWSFTTRRGHSFGNS